MTTGDARWRRIAATAIGTATSSGADALAAWDRRPDDFDLDEVWDADLLHTLGLAGQSLVRAGWDGPERARLAGLTRKNWVEHRIELARWAPIVNALASRGIDAWIAGGAALARAEWAYGDRPGERWAGDTTVAVRRSDAAAAASALGGLGAVARSRPRIERRVRLHGGMPVRLDDARWGQLAWAPSPHWPVADEPLTVGDAFDDGGVRANLVDRDVAVVAACLGAEFDGPSLGGVLDLHRMVIAGAAEPAIVRADSIGARSIVARWLDAVDRLDTDQSFDWLDDIVRTRRRRAVVSLRAAAFRLGRAGVVRSSPDLLAERWGVERVTDLPVAFGSRVGERVRHLHSSSRAR